MNTERLIRTLIETYIAGCKGTDAGCFMDDEFRATFVECCSRAVKCGVMELDASATARISLIERDIRKAVQKSLSIR